MNLKKGCLQCGVKLGLISFSCRCQSEPNVFCTACRIPKFKPEDATGHICNFDYKQEGKDRVEKMNPKIDARKIEFI